MTSRDGLIELAAHMEWADSLVWATLLQSLAARDDARLRGVLHHVHTVQRVFVGTWRGLPLQLTDVNSFEGPPALAAWGRAGLLDIHAFLAEADDVALGQPIEMPWARRITQGAKVTAATLAQSATHLALHSSHHRGQANIRLRELGAEPPLVDYIAWVWKGRPTPQWPRNVVALAEPTT